MSRPGTTPRGDGPPTPEASAERPAGLSFFATAAKGTEAALRDELRELRVRGVRADRGGVHFAGHEDDAWRVCLESRIAVRVLQKLAAFPAADPGALYAGVSSVDWSEFLTPASTLAVRAACRSSALTHTQFIAQKTKDAVVDQLRARMGARPSVDLEQPDLGIFVHLVRDEATVYVDLAGEPLHRRGWRPAASGGRSAAPPSAPLKETLAAAVLRLSGWDRALPLVDPMCGAGTLAIEAALWARRVAPGLGRARFGFERWARHTPEAARRLAELRDRVRSAARSEGPPIVASDVDPAALRAAEASARAAGVEIRFERRSVAELQPTSPPGHVVLNPPYGERLAVTPSLYRDLGSSLRELRGHTVSVLIASAVHGEIVRSMRRRYDKSLTLYNGDIECRLIVWPIPG